MLPIKLQLHNFMSYGEDADPLDFRGVDLACLSGNNGVGKSTILEAMTWALWGRSRAKSDDDLIRLGCEEMWVEFEFEVEGVMYKVIRKRTKKKKKKGGYATSGGFEFMISRGLKQDGSWQSASEHSKAETQEKVIETLRMDYDTFVNSAFLRQGHADEFTIKKPQERKTILAEILGLSYYDKLQEKAKELRRSRDIEKESSEQLVESLAEELDSKENIIKEERQTREILEKLQAEVGVKEKKVGELAEKRSALELKKKEAQDLTLKINELEKEIEDLKNEYEEKEQSYKETKEIISNKSEIEKNYEELKNLKKENDRLTKVRMQQYSLDTKKRVLEDKIRDSKEKIKIEQANNLEKIKEYEKEIKCKDKLKEEKKRSEIKLKDYKEKEEKKDTTIKRIQKGNERKAEIKTQKSQTQALGVELRKKIETIKNLKGVCPLCEQKMNEAHKKKALGDLEKEINDKRISYKKLDGREKKCDEKISELEGLVKKLERELQKQKEEERNFYNLEKSLEEIGVKEKDLNRLRDKHRDLISEMEKGNFDLESVKELNKIEAELKKLTYSEKGHREVEEKINKLVNFEKLNNDLYMALEREKGDKEYLEKNKSGRKAREKLYDESRERRERLLVEVKVLDSVMSDLIEGNKELQDLRMQLLSIQSEYGAVKEKLDRVNSQEKELKDKKQQLKKAGLESSIYNELAQAFSKTGIQAMIIESAIPEIEEEANKLLSKMTDSQMEVRFLTQKEKKSDGELQETLDIQIIDEAGVRDYEMFSGGEAFRINFAIRIALSKLLAGRSGAKLQLLVIDEGFGTQDNIGQEYIIEALNSIKNDFKKILIITHIQSLKDMFQTRIEVTKNENGSRFEITS